MRHLRNLRARLFGPQCQHQWYNTGLTHTTLEGITIVLRACHSCPDTLIVQV